MTRAEGARVLQELAATRQHLEETGRILRALVARLKAMDRPAPPTDPGRT